MSIESVINDRATAFSALTALIGTDPVRLYFQDFPQDVSLPAVKFYRISAPRVSCMGSDSGLVLSRFSFDVYAADATTSRSVIDQLRSCFQRWRNSTGTVVQDTFVVADADLGMDPDTREYHSVIDFEFIYQE